MEPLPYQGVSKQGDGTYIARIVASGHRTQLGTYKNPEDAARAYDVAALALFETSAMTNFPMEAYSFAEVARVKRSLASGGGMSYPLLNHTGAPGPLIGSPVKRHRHSQDSLAAATPEAESLASAPPTRDQQHTTATATAPGSTPNKRRHLALGAGDHKFQSTELPHSRSAGGHPAAAAPATLQPQQLLNRPNSSTGVQAAAAAPTKHAGFGTSPDVQDVREQPQPSVSRHRPTTAVPAGSTKDQLQQHLSALHDAGKADLPIDKLPRSPADIVHGPAAPLLRDQQQHQPFGTSDHKQQLQQEPDLLASLIRSADSGRFACTSPATAAGNRYADVAGQMPQQPSVTAVDVQLQRMNSNSSMGSPGNAGIHAPSRPPNRRKPSSSSNTKDEQQQQQQQQQQQPVAVPTLRRGSFRASAAAAAWGWTAESSSAAATLGSGAAGTSYRGIILRRNGRYDGRLTVLGVKLYLGVFENPADAAAAYDLAALALYEDNAATNFPRSGYSAADVAARRAELLSKLANHQNIGGSQAGQQAREWAAAQLARDQQQQEQVGKQRNSLEAGHLTQTAATLVPGRTQAVGRARAAAVAAAAVAAARVSKRVSGGSSSSSGRQQGLVPVGAMPKKPRLRAALGAAAAGGGSSRSRSQQQHSGHISGVSANATAAGIDVDGLWGEYAAHNDVLDSLFGLIEAAASLSPTAHAAAAAAARQDPAIGTAAASPGLPVHDTSVQPGNRSSEQRQQQQPATPVRPLAMLLSCLSPRTAAAAARLPAAADAMDVDDRDTLAEALLAGSAAKSLKEKTESPVAERAKNPGAQNPRAQNPVSQNPRAQSPGIHNLGAQKPMILDVCWGGKLEDVKSIKTEQSESVASLKERSCRLFGLDIDKVEIWDFFHRVKYASLEDKLELTLHEARILAGQNILLDSKDAPLVDDVTPLAPLAAAAPTIGPGAAATAATAAKTTKAEDSTEQHVLDHDPAADTGLHASCNPPPPAAAAADVDVCRASVADAVSCEQQQQQQRSRHCTISSRSDGKSLSADAGKHIELPAAAAAAAAAAASAARAIQVGSVPGQQVVNSSLSPPAAAATATAAAAAVQRAFSVTSQISPSAVTGGAADTRKNKRLLRSLSSGSSTGRGSRSSSTTPAPMEVAAAAAAAAAGTENTLGSDNSRQTPNQPNQQDRKKGRYCNSRFSKSPPARPKAAAAAAAKPAKRKASPSPAAAAAAAEGVDGSAAARATRSSGTPPLSKASGPGCVSHAQNPTRNMGVRSRKGRFESFLATSPFRYLYLGQYDTVDAAVAARDAAMLVLYGPGAIAAHGPAWVSTTAAADAAVEGSAAAAAVLDMAARLMKKDNVPGEMKDNGTEYLLDLVRERQQQQQKEGLEKTAAAERKAA